MLAAPFGTAATNPDSAVVVPCSVPTRQPMPAPSQVVSLSVEHGGLLSLVEHGQEVGVRASDVVEIATPPRLGRFSVLLRAQEQVQITRARPGAAEGYISITLNCAPDDQAMRAREWEALVQALEHEIAVPLSPDAYESLASRLEAIRTSAAPGYASALAAHLRAQSLLMAGRSADATAAFAVAKQEWLALGDRERALAALVAQAEDTQRSGAYRQVLALARSLSGAPDREHYFGVRLENSRCLALQYLAEFDESSNCFEWTMRALADLGETLERISTQQDYAYIERDRGNLEHATALAAEALAEISAPLWDQVRGPDIPIVRGRVERLLSSLSVSRGDIAEGLRHSQRALAHFDQAHHLRWQANTLLSIAAIYNQIGAHADAIDAVEVALKRLSSRDAPERVAEAELTKADIELAAGSTQLAIEQATKARSMYESLQRPAYAAAANLTLAEANLASGQTGAAHAILDSMALVPPAFASRAELVGAELAVRDARMASSRFRVGALARSVARPLPEWLRVQVVLAKQMYAEGNHAAALRLLEKAAMHVSDLAWRAQNPVLRVAIERQRRRLLSGALPMFLAARSMDEKAEAVWRWILLTEGVPPRNDSGQRPPATGEFDRALAESLLPSSRVGSDKPNSAAERLQKHLLELVTDASIPAAGIPRGVPDVSLRQFQAMLPHGTVFLAFMPGESSLAVLAVSAEKSEVLIPPGDAAALRRRTLELTSRIAAHDSLAKINEDAAELSQALLGVLDGMPLPRHLLVLAPEPLNGFPWPLLRWPNSPVPLVETTTVSVVAPGARIVRDNEHPVSFHVFAAAAPETGADESGLPALAAADTEDALVADERRKIGWRIAATTSPTRASLLSALADRAGWVHIAGHGSNSAEYLGRSGLWLTDIENSGKPDLLSWMDVVEQGIQADVVVLNACALASSPSTSLSASTGFAEATLRAGANDVVAALWPINDTAASLWASTFYTHLSAHPTTEEIGDALRASMLRLRDTRAFRHPRYWASLVHLARIDLPAMASTAPTAAAR